MAKALQRPLPDGVLRIVARSGKGEGGEEREVVGGDVQPAGKARQGSLL